MPASTWKGYLSFGLISLPIRLYSAARYSHVAFHEIHRECGHRVHHQLYCPYDEKVVPRDEIVMGYEIDKDKYVLVDPSEMKALLPPSSTAMEIIQFVKLSEVDPIYFETSYFVLPEKAGTRAYTLLVKTLGDLQFAAIAKVTMHQRERTAIIRCYQNGLTLHTIYYPNEIHQVKEYGNDPVRDIKKQETKLAEEFAKGLLKPFRPEAFHDKYQESVKKLVESKEAGHEGPKVEKTRRLAPVVDLMTALKKSLADRKPSTAAKPRRKTA